MECKHCKAQEIKRMRSFHRATDLTNPYALFSIDQCSNCIKVLELSYAPDTEGLKTRQKMVDLLEALNENEPK